MSGALFPSGFDPRSEPDPADPEADEEPIFTRLVASDPAPRTGRAKALLRMSAVGHVGLLAAIVLVPLFMPGPAPAEIDAIRALLYDPPPPPPPPLPKGSALVQKAERPRPVTPDKNPEKPRMDDPTPKLEEPLKPEARPNENSQAGSPTGSDLGVPEGMEGGVEGGMVGGVPGGVLGGVIGGTGSIVTDYDQPPRLLKQVRPTYPQDAFVKKIEGVVMLDVIIDSTGHVAAARVVQSVALLDAAALQCVRQWIFSPAMKHGQPVAIRASVPVTFRIF